MNRCLIDTGSYPDRSSRDDITTNNDGPVDLYFGPAPPAGKATEELDQNTAQQGMVYLSACTARRSRTSTRRGCYLISNK
jgi:hypothetical protein